MKIEPDTMISHYKILSEIGKGGMGEVYLAEDTKLNRKVAIKFLSQEFVDDVDKLNRFVQEAQSASALNHPNIITVFEIGETDNTQYIALEFIEGETLTTRLKKKLKFNSALDIATQIASALDAAHSAGIVHRDIKPDNVMVRKDGLVKILDFGIAKLTEKRLGEGETRKTGEEDKTLIAASPKTIPGMIIGTANYMSPEQAKGKEIDARTDIFSFGVLLYEMVTGELPFSGESPLEIIGSVLKDEPKPIEMADAPPEIVRVINKALRKDPDERYQTIKGLLVDLKDVKGELEFQNKLEKTVQPHRAEHETQMFKATTAAEVQNTTASENVNDSISIKKSSFSKVLMGVAAFFVLAATGIGFWYFGTSRSNQIDSIAVMPFVNESGDKEIEYLSDGMTETLINSLSAITDLRVKTRSSVFRYKGKDFNAKTIASELGVQAILTGRVVQNGDRLTLNLELIDPETESTIWGNRYERESSQLLALQTEITRDVLNELKSRLSGEDNVKIAAKNTDNSEAYKLYLKGRYYWEKRTGKDLLKSLEFYDQAIAADPNYALAHTGRAESYGLLSIYGVSTPRATMPLAREAAKKALELNGNLAEAHSALGNVLFRYDYDFHGAERELKRAIELKPKYGIAQMWYAELLSSLGRHDEALQSIQRALEIDPFFLTFNRVYAGILTSANRLDEAEEQYKKTIELDENYSVTYAGLGSLYEIKKDYAKAVETFARSAELSGKRETAAALRNSFKNGGWANYLRTRIERVDSKIDGQAYAGATIKLYCFVGLGENDKAINELNKLFEMRSAEAASIKVDKLLDPIRSEPGFKELMKKLGFPE